MFHDVGQKSTSVDVQPSNVELLGYSLRSWTVFLGPETLDACGEQGNIVLLVE